MHSVRIQSATDALYPRFRQACDASFPANERRGPEAQDAAFADPRYRLDIWLDGDSFIGFMGWWDFGDFRYVEHVAVAPELRSGGYGKKLLRAWMNSAPTPVWLEIEEVVDEPTRRRLGFYKRLNFMENPGVHMQPPYQGNGGGVPLQVLSWPDGLDQAQHKRFIDLLHKDVWANLGSKA